MSYTGLTSRKLGIAVFMAALVTYAGTVGFGYLWDDPYLIGRVKQALSQGQVWELFTRSFYVKTVSAARYYRPVMFASLLGETVLTGGKPWFSHLVNIFLHALNATLLFVWFRKILRENRGALVGALLFAVHPVNSGTVAAVYNRMDLLTLALTLPLFIYWTGMEDDGGQRRVRTAAWPLLLYFLACLTKETAFMVPAVLLGWEALRLKRPGRQRVVFIALTAAALGAAVCLRATVFAREAAGQVSPGVRAGTFLHNASITQVLKIVMVNIRMAVLPFPGRTHWAATDFNPGWEAVLAVVLLLMLIYIGFRMNPRTTGRALVWWSVFTLPVSGIIYLGPVIANERYAYIPLVGLCLLVGGITASLPARIRDSRRAAILAVAVLILLGIGSAAQTRVWKSEVALFREVAATNPHFATGYLNLGAALARQGKFEEARRVYDRALILVPERTDIVFNRGNLFFKMGKYEEALADYDTVLRKNPEDWEAFLNRGNVLAAMGRREEAAGSYRKALEADGRSGKPLVALGVLAARAGNLKEAVHLFEEAGRREPGLAEAFEGLGESYLALGMNLKAQEAWLKALEISPGNGEVAMKLGWLLLQTGRPGQAEYAFRTALAADRSKPGAWLGLVRSLDAAGHASKADDLIRDLKGTDPGLAEEVAGSRGGGRKPQDSR